MYLFQSQIQAFYNCAAVVLDYCIRYKKVLPVHVISLDELTQWRKISAGSSDEMMTQSDVK